MSNATHARKTLTRKQASPAHGGLPIELPRPSAVSLGGRLADFFDHGRVRGSGEAAFLYCGSCKSTLEHVTKHGSGPPTVAWPSSRPLHIAFRERPLSRPLIGETLMQNRPAATSLYAILAIAIVIAVWGQLPASAASTDRPNVILLMTDDQGYGDLGADGNTMIDTPNMDRLWSESARLTNFHVDPTCAPTRSALLSGRYSNRTGIWHTIMGRSLMSSAELTIAEVFRANGYHTGMYGKWHLGDNYPCRPQDQGFEDVVCHGGGGVGQGPVSYTHLTLPTN